jgi:hypothetical protein
MICNVCGDDKADGDFSFSGLIGKKGQRKGQRLRRTTCKKCINKRKHDGSTESRRFKQHEDAVLRNIKRRSDNCNLNRQWLRERLNAGVCELTHLRFDYTKSIFRPSIDRIDPNKGYITDNCRLVCLGFNMMRSDSSDEDAFILAKAIVNAKERLKQNSGIIYETPNWAR